MINIYESEHCKNEEAFLTEDSLWKAAMKISEYVLTGKIKLESFKSFIKANADRIVKINL